MPAEIALGLNKLNSVDRRIMTFLSRETRITALSVSLLFLASTVGAPLAVARESPTFVPLATPLSQLEANWSASSANLANWNFSPQNQINSSNAQYLTIKWLFPLPTHPTALLNVAGGLGVGATPMIINGTIYAVTNFAQAFALNAA